ncbi:MAG TPA: MFS transporter [Abditibacterium sp.]
MTSSPSPPTPFLNDAQRAAARKVILFTAFLDILGFSIIIPQLPVYATQFGATPQMTGVLASVYSLMGFLFTPFWGRLSDRVGRRPVLIYSIFGTALSFILFAFASSLPWLFAARILDGITGANISTAQAYLSDITEPAERAKNFGFFGAIFGIAFAIGPLIGSALTHLPGAWGGNLGLGVFSATLSFLNWALAVRFLRETLSPEMRAQNEALNAQNKRGLINFSGFSRALAMPKLNRVIVIGFLATAAFATIQGTYALFILKDYTRPLVQREIRDNPSAAIARARKLREAEQETRSTLSLGEGASGPDISADATAPYPASMGGDFGLKSTPAPAGYSWRHIEKLIVRPETARQVGTIFGIIGLLSLVVQGGLIRPLQKRVSEVSLVLAGTLIMAIGLVSTAAMQELLPGVMWGQYLAACILTLGNGLATPVLTSLVSQLAPDNERGEILGVFQSVQSLGRIVGPNLGGFLFGAVASGAPFVAGGAIMMVSFFLAFRLRGVVAPGKAEARG